MSREFKSVYVTYQLDRVSSVARAEANKIYLRECGIDIRLLRILRRVAAESGASVSRIVETAMFERTLVSRLISELAKRGLVERRISTQDARQFSIHITKSGKEMAEMADELGRRLNEDLLASLDDHERVVFSRCLEKLEAWCPRPSVETSEASVSVNKKFGGGP